MSRFNRAGLNLSVHDSGGTMPPVLMQHGLGGSAGQIAELTPEGARFVTLECRGHGASEAGDPEEFSIATFADDVIALLETIGPSVIGGVSMGAAIATRIGVIRPDLVKGLMLVRPAWLTESAPANMSPNLEVGRLLQNHPPEAARAIFDGGVTASMLARQAPDNLASLHGFFTRVPIAVTAELLTRISLDGPGITEADLDRIAVPAIVIGHERDAVHPVALARKLTSFIPKARFIEITPKVVDKRRYLADLKSALTHFLKPFAKV